MLGFPAPDREANARTDAGETAAQFGVVMTGRQKLADDVWLIRHDAHQIHHRIADFIIHKDEREHPVGLRNLVKKYKEMMRSAEELTDIAPGKSGCNDDRNVRALAIPKPSERRHTVEKAGYLGRPALTLQAATDG